jgi:uncharacterized protein (DUF697 family)
MGLAGRGAKFARPYAEAVRAADATSREGGRIAILPGDPVQTQILRDLLGGPDAGPSEDALAVMAVTPGTDLSVGLATLARRRRSGGHALAIVVGDPADGPAVEARLLARRRIEPSNVAHTPSLEGEGARMAIEAIIRVLGDDAAAAARQYPALRQSVGRDMVERASRRAGVVGTLPLPGVDLPVLALIQVRLVAELAAIHDRPGGAERVAEAAAVVGAGFGWRALARSASGLVPGVGWAVRGTVAYGATRAVGEAALLRAQAGHDMFEGAAVDRIRPVVDRALARIRR